MQVRRTGSTGVHGFAARRRARSSGFAGVRRSSTSLAAGALAPTLALLGDPRADLRRAVDGARRQRGSASSVAVGAGRRAVTFGAQLAMGDASADRGSTPGRSASRARHQAVPLRGIGPQTRSSQRDRSRRSSGSAPRLVPDVSARSPRSSAPLRTRPWTICRSRFAFEEPHLLRTHGEDRTAELRGATSAAVPIARSGALLPWPFDGGCSPSSAPIELAPMAEQTAPTSSS